MVNESLIKSSILQTKKFGGNARKDMNGQHIYLTEAKDTDVLIAAIYSATIGIIPFNHDKYFSA